jgi:predicted ATPase/DNA-binding SARP family transcriptional activator
MTRLSISLLGNPQISLDGALVKVSIQRTLPLLAYLALTGKSQTRETLANLLWSDSSLTHALASLRTTLWRLKSTGLEDWIKLENNEISLNNQKTIEVDVLEFKAYITKCASHGHPPSQICLYCVTPLTQAVELYHGEFLAGINVSNAQVFDDWRLQENETLHILYLDALERLVRCHRTFGDFNLAIQYARSLIHLDRYNETAQYDLLQLYSITGQRAAAINQYKRYKELLSRELAIEPSEDITNLYKQILMGRVDSTTTLKAKSPIFLIADIEKAALLWVQAGVNKEEFLSTYHSIFKETARRFGGHILQKNEDNITLLFEKGNPLHCAVTIHLRLKKIGWGEAGQPNVRMVLYSTSTNEKPNYDFAAITQAASRLLSISWGGQILFTEQTLRLLDQPSGSHIQDLGFHALKDINDQVHIYELLHPHLPSIEHPPLQSISLGSVNFPTFTPAFIDREAELKELTALIDNPDCRIISLVGPGGIGKTRLAVELATRVNDWFPDGTYFISLAPIQDPDLIPIILADALKFSFYGTRNHTDQLIDYLHRMKTLLVFDNFEHLRSQGASFLAHLLSFTHNLKIIVTTRERLNMIAETTLEVSGLPVPPNEQPENLESYSSIKLFMLNAQRSSPKFSLENNSSAIIRICQLLNGLPLGIVLASSWARVYSCQRIAEEITKNIDFLDISSPDLPPRQRSLRAVFDHSWLLLNEDERRILRLLAVFPVPFTAHAAERICSAPNPILASLLDKSLLQRHDDRFEMLTTFQQYAMGKLEEVSEEYESTHVKFADYYTAFCERINLDINSPIQREALGEMSSEIENIRAAWNWMVENNRWDMLMRMKDAILAFHIITGYFIQGREFFRLALARLNKLDDQRLGLVHTSMKQLEAWMAIRNGFLSEGIQRLSECLEGFRTHDAPFELTKTMMFLADASYVTGNHQQGKKYIEDALQNLHEANLPNQNTIIAIQAHCQSILGSIQIRLGDYEQARSNLQAALATHLQIGTHYGTIHPLLGLGRLAYLQGELTQARDLYLQALETSTKLYDQRGMALIHNNLGAIYEDTVNISESYHHVVTALKLCRETGDRRLTAVILNNLAYHQMKYQQHPAEAIRTYHESIEIFDTIGDLRGLTYSYYDISKAYLKVGLLAEAFGYCLQSLNTALTLDNIPLILHALHGFAHFYANTGQQERALRLCHLVGNHSQVDSDTQKRAIVSRVELEAMLPPEVIQSAHSWAESTVLQDVIEQILAESTSRRK